MVSWLIRIAGSSGNSTVSLPLACSGEYRRSSSCWTCAQHRVAGQLRRLGAALPLPGQPVCPLGLVSPGGAMLETCG
jgi:hypothetical protein